MESEHNYFDDLKTIKKIMEESSRFLSLSGLSGLFAGVAALLGGAVAYFLILHMGFFDTRYLSSLSESELSILSLHLFTDAMTVLVLAIGASLFFSYRKAAKSGEKIWTPVSLGTGGLFIIIISWSGYWQLIIPSMLIFYGLALINACKFTYNEIFYLGIIEICTGLISGIFPEYGLLFWCFGFGILHITYGLLMYRKYK